MIITISCKSCTKEFQDYASNHRQYCSMACRAKDQIGKPSGKKGWKMSKEQIISISKKLTGRKLSEDHKRNIGKANIGKVLAMETREKLAKAHKGERAYNWKGNDASYSSLHKWIRRLVGNPERCEHCDKLGQKEGRKWNLDWANISHKYLRDVNDFMGLCKSCHREYDINLVMV